MKAIFILAIFTVISMSAIADEWTEYKSVGVIQSYGGDVQVWLDGFSCPNSKPYFTVAESHISSVDRIFSMILMAKASKTMLRFQYNTNQNSSFCYVTGIRVE